MQARTAELLQLHTELRRTLFGSSSVLARSILPSAISLDLLKFLKLWDYEGGLSPAVRKCTHAGGTACITVAECRLICSMCEAFAVHLPRACRVHSTTSCMLHFRLCGLPDTCMMLLLGLPLLSCLQDRRIIDDALTREVVRVHRQLQHAAIQLKGPAQLPALQAWDAAFSQVSSLWV